MLVRLAPHQEILLRKRLDSRGKWGGFGGLLRVWFLVLSCGSFDPGVIGSLGTGK